MLLERTLTLDINPKAKLQTVFVKQCDDNSNKFTVSFVNSVSGTAQAVNITPGQTVKFRCLKPSGAGCIYTCTVSDGKAILILDAASTAEDGLTLADLTIEESGVVLSTAAFWLNVKKSGISNNLTGTSEYKELEDTIATAQALIEELQGGAIIKCEDENNDGNVVISFTRVDP